jgi:phenylalanyl-tRNA synthetase alpha chain
MDTKKLIASLHPLERRVLPVLERCRTPEEISAVTKLKEVEVMRALQWLEKKSAVEVRTELKNLVVLDKNGRLYLSQGLPERRFLNALKAESELPVPKIAQKTKLSAEEVNICIGTLRKKAAILLSPDKGLKAKLTDEGKRLLGKELLEERFLRKEFPLDISILKDEDKLAFESLRKRKEIIRIEQKKQMTVCLTPIGKHLVEQGVSDVSIIDRMTPDILRSGEWRKKSFRRYDLAASAPKENCGKFQHYRHFLDYIRKSFMRMGFTEMTGPIVENDFWDMDALYMPQFHSARDIHQAYYLKEPKEIPVDRGLLQRVAAAHENGGKTGSKGWGYRFDPQRTLRTLLRTQGTACSSRMLASKDLRIPGKYFGITRCFRYDVIDATHLPDFNQTEGIVVGEGLTLRHLVGLLRQFAREFADTDEVRVVPGYFPFTEPSAELFAKHPQMGWIELGGAGIFRPEVVQPLLGKHVSVLAWGIGIDRIAMFKLGIKDIRDLYSHNMETLRSSKVI